MGGWWWWICLDIGSATVDNVISSANVPDFDEQVQAFTSDLADHSPGAGPFAGKSMIAAWVGINSVTKVRNLLLDRAFDFHTPRFIHLET